MDLGGAKGGVKSDINVTPLVDVMLVLLIIMILVAPMLNEGVSVRSPRARNTEDKPSDNDTTMLVIAANGDFYLNTRPVTQAELGERVTEILETKTEKVVFIKADQDTSYGDVMAAFDQLRLANVENIGLITDPNTDQQPGAAGGR
jgi:biopolymer transport protein ExbD